MVKLTTDRAKEDPPLSDEVDSKVIVVVLHCLTQLLKTKTNNNKTLKSRTGIHFECNEECI